jgi:putative membrane protein
MTTAVLTNRRSIFVSRSRFSLAALGLAVASLSAAPLFAADGASVADKAFVGKVSQGGAYEVEASKVALQKATAPDVKDLAATEVHDHEGVNANLKQIAEATGVEIAPQLNAEFQQRLAKLNAVSGAGFDQAYLADMKQIHDKDEKLFAQEAVAGSASYKTFAHETDQIVKRHIGALGVSTSR